MILSPDEFVRRYESWGWHRTGWPADTHTREWLATLLEVTGWRVESAPWMYDHYRYRCQVTLNGVPVPSLPLHYHFSGRLSTTERIRVVAVEIDPQADRFLERLLELEQEALDDGCEALLVATRGPTRELYAENVPHGHRGTLPIVLLPGHRYEALAAGKISLRLEASTESRRGNNLVAVSGHQPLAESLLVTTPVSGWYHCAGERAGGLYLALRLAEQLARHNPVRLLLTSGHEIGYLGGHRYADRQSRGPLGVLHLGSCIGAAEARMQLRTNLSAPQHEQVLQALGDAMTLEGAMRIPAEGGSWFGESECWARFGRPMISLGGTNPLFHTSGDRGSLAISGDRLPLIEEGLAAAAALLVDQVDVAPRVVARSVI